MKKKQTKYQRHFDCFIVCIVVPYPFWFGCQQRCESEVLVRGATLIRGRRLFQCGCPKLRSLLEGSAYLRAGSYQRKYGNCKLNCLLKTDISQKKVDEIMIIMTLVDFEEWSTSIVTSVFKAKIEVNVFYFSRFD